LTFGDALPKPAVVHAIRATCLLRFREQVIELGADPDEILASVGVPPGDAGRFDRCISLRGAVEAVELAADRTDAPDFGRRLAARRGIETIGPVGVAAQSAPSLRDAFTIFATFISAHSPGLQVRLDPLGDTAFFEFRILLDPPPRQRQAIEISLGAALQILRSLLGPDYAPLSAHLPHSAMTPPADYARDFGCTTHFAQPSAGFVLRAADLRRRLRHGHLDGPAHHAAVADLARLVAESGPELTPSVTDLVRALLPSGMLSIETVAAHLELHPRALQRRLAAEGTSYGALVDKLRRHTAEQCLRDTDISLDHLTRLLGYSEQSVLTRSSQRWFGCSPTAYRIANR
jgi:AraC-like DNA-binding protein